MEQSDLKRLADLLRKAADIISEPLPFDSPDAGREEPEFDPEPQLSLEDVRTVLSRLTRSGHTDEVRGLLEKYGAKRLSDVDPSNYSALLKGAEGITDAS